MNSVTKTFAGALTGIAIEEGIIESVDTPMLDFFTEASNPDQQAITVEHLVTMTAGVEWDELRVPYGSTANYVTQFERLENPVNAFLNLEVVDEPGTQFNYCSGCMDMLTAIIEANGDESALHFAETRLFEPLGIDTYRWRTNPQGIIHGGYGLSLTLPDMVHFGQLYLNNGVWNGEQVIPANWIAESTQRQTEVGSQAFIGTNGYGWWILNRGGYMVSGSNGQRLYVLSEYDAVIGMVGGVNYTQAELMQEIFGLIVSAFAPEPLPENPEALTRLSDAIEQFEGKTPHPPERLPEIAEAISGRTLVMDENAYGLEQAVMTFNGNDEAHVEQIIPSGVLGLTVGLDGVFRENVVQVPTFGALRIAAKGQWTYDNTFELTLRWVEQGDELRFRFIFDDDTFTLNLASFPIDGQGRVRVNGTVQE